MTEVLLIITLILAALCALFSALAFFKKRKENDEWREPLRRIADMQAETEKLVEYLSRQSADSARDTEARLINMQNRLADDIKYIVDSNAQNLDRIRRTVDEKLSASLDGKLSESYARISERLEKMYESVGAMRAISGGVEEIRRVFTNVKLRGTWGEAQLDALLAQMLAPEQYAHSVKLDPMNDLMVDFAVLLPRGDGSTVYLPIDSKLPVEEYSRLVQCSEQGDKAGEEIARRNLERVVRTQADSIVKKYVHPPKTTDFAVMYLPSEAIYAEVARYNGLSDYLRARRVIACGPTNLAALLSTLQAGFRSAAIERRSGELIETLEMFRREFEDFALLLEKTKKKLKEAQDAVDSAEKRTGAIGKTLVSFRAIGVGEEDGEDGEPR